MRSRKKNPQISRFARALCAAHIPYPVTVSDFTNVFQQPSELNKIVLGFDLVSDECRFNLSHADGRERVYRRRGERLADA